MTSGISPAPDDTFFPPRRVARSASRTPSRGEQPAEEASCRAIASACSWELFIVDGPVGEILVLQVAGEIDISTLPLVHDALDAVASRRPGDLVVDLAGLSFCSVRGLVLLTGTMRTATGTVSHAVSGLDPRLDRIVTLLWPGRDRIRYPSAAAAVAAVRIDQTRRLTG